MIFVVEILLITCGFVSLKRQLILLGNDHLLECCFWRHGDDGGGPVVDVVLRSFEAPQVGGGGLYLGSWIAVARLWMLIWC